MLFRLFHLGLKLVVVQDARMIAGLGNRMIMAAVRNNSGDMLMPCEPPVLHERQTILWRTLLRCLCVDCRPNVSTVWVHNVWISHFQD